MPASPLSLCTARVQDIHLDVTSQECVPSTQRTVKTVTHKANRCAMGKEQSTPRT
jgi:hypothetical protein